MPGWSLAHCAKDGNKEATLGIVFAITAALSWGISAIFVRMGAARIDTSFGTLISLAAGLVFSMAIALVFAWNALVGISLSALLLFAIIGMFQYPMGRFFNYQAVSRVGIAGSTPLSSTSPLFAVALAILLTGERMTLPLAVGAALIFAGVYLTVTRGDR